MSLLQTLIETLVRFIPDKATDPLIEHSNNGYIGKPLNRVDGPLKVRGQATFSAEYKFDKMAYAALCYSPIATGKIIAIDQTVAKQAAGVIAVITHENAPKMDDPAVYVNSRGGSEGASQSDLPVFRDDKIHWNGQPVAVVVAETQEQAEHAASLIRVDYKGEVATLSFNAQKPKAVQPKDVVSQPAEVDIGDAVQSLEEADVKVDLVYRTPRYNHNAIEPHATIAAWSEDGDQLLVLDGTSNLYSVRNALAKMFDLKPKQVRVVSPFVGGSFGGKGTMWWGTILCVAAAKVVNRPVNLTLSREGVFRAVGGRSLTEQRVALGAQKGGKLVSLLHTGISAMTGNGGLVESFSISARHLYASENIYIEQKIVNLDTVATTWMRAPGEAVGSFALESAMDELAHMLTMNPVDLRRMNEPTKDPTKGTAFSMRNLLEAYRRGAEQFGWQHRPPRSQQDGPWLIGQGVATAYYGYLRVPATARVRITSDGRAIVQTAAHEMGMGTATAQLQHAAERLGLPIDRVSFHYGDSDLPESAMAAAQGQTASVIAAVAAAIETVHKQLLSLVADQDKSPLAELDYDQVEARNGGLSSKQDASIGASYADILKRAGREFVEAEEKSGAPLEMLKYSMHAYGAQFCEVRVHEAFGEVRISRWLGSFDCGRILNPKTATSQLRGGIIFGIGQALTEETLFDERNGRIMNPSLAEYHVPVHLDIPPIDIIYNDIPDKHAPLGAHGVAEIGVTGVAAAIANAVFNATGKRIRELPITLDKVL